MRNAQVRSRADQTAGGVRRLGFSLMAAAFFVLIGLLPASPAQATPGFIGDHCSSLAYACVQGGYEATAATTGDGWAWKYYGQGATDITTPSGPHNCTLYAAWRLEQAGMPDPGHAWGDAVSWGDSLGFDHNPAVGSIAWWQSGDHVAYVEQVSADKTQVFVRADNYWTPAPGGYTDSGWVSVNGPTGFLHPWDNDGATATAGRRCQR